MPGQYAYVLKMAGYPTQSSLSVFNLNDPTNPTIVGQVALPGTMAYRVKIVGSLAYVADGTSGLQIVDVSNPAAPKIIGSLSLSGTAYAVAVANGYAYVAGYSAVYVINVSNPSSPFIVQSVPIRAMNLALAGTRLFLGCKV